VYDEQSAPVTVAAGDLVAVGRAVAGVAAGDVGGLVEGVLGVTEGRACGVLELHDVTTEAASSRQVSNAIGRGTGRR
jgi:hypothetical protein